MAMVRNIKKLKSFQNIKLVIERIKKTPSPFSAEFAASDSSDIAELIPTHNKSTRDILLEKRDSRITEDKNSVRELTLAFSTIALGAKLAKIDGEINNDEIKSFKKFFPRVSSSKIDFDSFFGNAANDDVSFEHYAKKVISYFPKQQTLYKELILSLFEFGAVDGPLNSDEIKFLYRLNQIFGLDEDFFYATLRDRILPKSKDPYAILGINNRLSDADIKTAYRKTIQAYHPDRLASLKSAGRIFDIANERFAAIQKAYTRIKIIRDMK